jgi:hypothetical protein
MNCTEVSTCAMWGSSGRAVLSTSSATVGIGAGWSYCGTLTKTRPLTVQATPDVAPGWAAICSIHQALTDPNRSGSSAPE